MPGVSSQIARYCAQWGFSSLDFSGEHHSPGHQLCVCTNAPIPFQRKHKYVSNNVSAVLTSKLFGLDNQVNGCREHQQSHNHLGFLVLL